MPVVRSMCVFAADGCASGIPDDFPLAAGYPDDDEAEPGPGYGRHGPSRALAPMSFTACGRRLPHATHDDRLLARWTNVEDFRARQLTTFPDADRPPPASPPSPTSTAGAPPRTRATTTPSSTDVRRTAYGDESWAVVRRVELGGSPGVGLTVLHIVRVGRAVLVDTTSNEGGAGPDPEATSAARSASRPEPPPPSSPPCASSPRSAATEVTALRTLRGFRDRR